MMKTRWKFVVYAVVSVGAMVFVSALVFLSSPDFFVNTFLKGRITDAFQEAYPAYVIRIGSVHYSFRENRIGFDSVAVTARDSTLSCTIAVYSASGIGWLELLWAQRLVPDGFTGTVLDAQGIVMNFPQGQYELRCKLMHVSVPDSMMVIEALTIHPVGDDEQFFAGSKFRKTRFRLGAPYATVRGLAVLELLQGKTYRIRSTDVRDPSVDVLINKDKPAARDTIPPAMPNEILALMSQSVKVDSFSIWNGGVRYSERVVAGSQPGVVTLDGIQLLVTGIDNHGVAGDAVVIHVKGEFMQSAEMNVLMTIPVPSPEFSFQYAGAVGRLDLRALNSFLESSEQMRIKAGILQAATFDVTVASGRATGNVRAVYRDLTLAAIDKRTGSDRGFFDGIGSFMANTFKIRGTNVPDKSGSMKIGRVLYTRRQDDPFLGFAWYAVRSGVADVVGF
jgi:hypothetical protein